MAGNSSPIDEALAAWPDLPRVLGVGPEATRSNADPDALRRAYRRRALRVHPDKNGGSPRATEAFRRVEAAHKILSDPDLRGRYVAAGGGAKGVEAAEEQERLAGASIDWQLVISFLADHFGANHFVPSDKPSVVRCLAAAAGLTMALVAGLWTSAAPMRQWALAPDNAAGLTTPVTLPAAGADSSGVPAARVFVSATTAAAGALPASLAESARRGFEAGRVALCRRRRWQCAAAKWRLAERELAKEGNAAPPLGPVAAQMQTESQRQSVADAAAAVVACEMPAVCA